MKKQKSKKKKRVVYCSLRPVVLPPINPRLINVRLHSFDAVSDQKTQS